MSSALPDLNPPQAEAVAHVSGPLLVFAGAGSGKTRVITYRIANLVASARVPPYRILAVTFTNKAAGEMRSRLAKLLGDEIAKELWVGTFHATCAKLLRIHGAALGLARNFLIYDTSDQKAVVSRILKDLDLDEKRYSPRSCLERIHKEKQEGRGPEAMMLGSYMDDAIAKVYRLYEEALRSANAVDFEDLILYMDRILAPEQDDGVSRSEAARASLKAEAERIRKRFDYVLVDEFQDTNGLQYRFLRELASGHKNLCVVGDDDQSIYRWRGADVRNIRGFKHDFPDAKVVKLEQNYRSSKSIVSAALGVIASSKDREPKELWTANEAGRPVEVVGATDERDEAAFVVKVIREARAAGVEPREIAVFYRIHAQSRVLEEALRAMNIPYQIVGGMKFYERAEIKDALSYLRILVNPRSDVDLLRVINSPPRGIGQTTIERLTAYASRRGCSVFDALEVADEIDELGSAAKKKLPQVRDLLVDLRRAANELSPSMLLDTVLERTGYTKLLDEEDSAESDARLENLRELKGSLIDFEAEAAAAGEPATIESFLERVTLQADVDGMEKDARVTLMTVHSAKGLEFEVVALTGMEEEMFPYRGLDPGSHEEMDEERRLAYVAITRARHRLVLLHTQTRQIFGTTRYGRPSRFLGDLPRDVIEMRTTSGFAPRERFVDRAPTSSRDGGSAWQHPQSRSSSRPPPPSAVSHRPVVAREPGERFVDTEFFSDATDDADDVPALRRGSAVEHSHFGKGKVLSIGQSNLGEPSVVAFFPGWGEKKILVRFLKLG